MSSTRTAATILEQGFGVYTGGSANSSYFIKAGEMHMQEGEGTRAAMFYNLFSDPAFTLTNVDPINFSLDQHPVGVDVGYTLGVELLQECLRRLGQGHQRAERGRQRDSRFGSTKNSKDVWVDADYWFGPDGGVTVMMYRGSKDQIQNAGAEQSSSPIDQPSTATGVFGNYLFFDKLDLLGGYIRSQDDWQCDAGWPDVALYRQHLPRRGRLLHQDRAR